jgi:hypothetical protein
MGFRWRVPPGEPGAAVNHLGAGDPKIDEWEVRRTILDHDPIIMLDRPGLTTIADKGYELIRKLSRGRA